MTQLTISGITNHVVFRWLLSYLIDERVSIKEIEDNGEKMLITFHDQEEAFEAFQYLRQKTTQAEADYKLELTSY